MPEETVVEQPTVETQVEDQPVIPVTPAPASADIDFSSLSAREQALVQRARGEEKQKLYKDMRDLKETLRDLQTRLNTPPEDKKRKKDDDEPGAVSKLMEEISNLRREMSDRQRASELKEYRAQKIAEAKNAGKRLIDSLVFGESEEEIDASLEVSSAEAQFQYEAVKAEYEREHPPKPSTVVRQTARPTGVPPVITNPGSGDEDEDSFSMDAIGNLTSWQSLRDGTYAQNRQKLLAAIRKGKIRNA